MKVYSGLLEAFKRQPPEFTKKEKEEKTNQFEYLESRCRFTIDSYEFILRSLFSQREEVQKLSQRLHDLAMNNPNFDTTDSLLSIFSSKSKQLEKDLLTERSLNDDLSKRLNDLLSQNNGITATSYY